MFWLGARPPFHLAPTRQPLCRRRGPQPLRVSLAMVPPVNLFIRRPGRALPPARLRQSPIWLTTSCRIRNNRSSIFSGARRNHRLLPYRILRAPIPRQVSLTRRRQVSPSLACLPAQHQPGLRPPRLHRRRMPIRPITFLTLSNHCSICSPISKARSNVGMTKLSQA